MKINKLIILSGAVLLSGCFALTPNPDFTNCANACGTKQDTCMINASTASAIESCNASHNSCIQRCESKYPRHLN